MHVSKRGLGSDLKKVDETEPDAAAYAEIPELSDEFFLHDQLVAAPLDALQCFSNVRHACYTSQVSE